MKIRQVALVTLAAAASAFTSPSSQHSATSSMRTESTPLVSPLDAKAAAVDEVPPLKRNPPRKIALLVEPTPFTHVSGYANRFKEMLRYLSKAGDNVDILTVDAKTPKDELPEESFGYKIEHTQGFVFPLYDHISLTFDLPEMKGAKMMERRRPDLIHVTSPGFMVFAGLFYARVMRIPLLLSYHTHLPLYGRNYCGWFPGVEEFSWALLRFAHTRADLTLVTSPQMKEEMEENGIPRVEVWRKGIDTVRFDPKFRSEEFRSERMSDGNPDDFLMVYVGRLGAEKRLKDIKPMLEQMPNARLCFVGTGPQEDELKEHFKGTRTVFTGQLGGDELSNAFASADCFIMPSDSETLGFVVLESMASGVPVVGCKAWGHTRPDPTRGHRLPRRGWRHRGLRELHEATHGRQISKGHGRPGPHRVGKVELGERDICSEECPVREGAHQLSQPGVRRVRPSQDRGDMEAAENEDRKGTGQAEGARLSEE
ncbi:hypothetical protein THAOC_16464 [Thalassiosira oceanica]|uniref:Glycosyltransferase subfamily 4-like N-terminal domain-containing protein n=1 Tax=Thalassiosira oceanica TaxID=159749 RepID=K0SPG6_THAOC|nr:hypothetical protein THAOC_16464 [Thalassiosira oceanica]|eukprot:EJK62906.1 hypothetical protein THAOC_16464 [Thalassiosira oceanica]